MNTTLLHDDDDGCSSMRNPIHTRFQTLNGRHCVRQFFAAVVALSLFATSRATAAPSRYEVTDLGTLPGLAGSYEWNHTLNNRGHVAAYANNVANPDGYAGDVSFLWRGPGRIDPLPALPGATDTIVFGINDHDQAVGDSGPDGGVDHAVLWEHGVARDLGTLPGDTGSDAYQINNAGLVAADSYNVNVTTAVLWYRGRFFPLPSLNGAAYSSPVGGINDAGELAGVSGGPDFLHSHAVRWTVVAGVASVTDLGTLGGAASSAQTINNHGEAAGQAQTATGDWHATLWRNGEIVDLGKFGSDPFSCAFGSNNRGQIVGFSGQNFSDLTTAHALLWEGAAMIDLQTRIPAGTSWVLQQAQVVNDHGQIAGFGLHNGQIRAFLLTPAGADAECKRSP